MNDLLDKIIDRDTITLKQLVAKNQRLLYSIVLSFTNKENADDIIQMTWERAISKIHQLRNTESFTPWICRICRNILIEQNQKKKIDIEDIDVALVSDWNEKEQSFLEYEGHVRIALQMLTEEQRTVIQLKFFSNLSYSEIAYVVGINEKLVKSRLFEAKKKLRMHLLNLYDGITVSQSVLNRMEEYIMNKFEKALIGAEVFCSLSLYTQKLIVLQILRNEELSVDVLKEIGKIRKGSRFIEEYHKTILLPEFTAIIGACDRYTEKRLIKELEISEPSAAEIIKQNTYVFEDVAILSKESKKELFYRVPYTVLTTAMSIIDQKVKSMLLSDLSTEEQEKWYIDIGKSNADIEEVKKAQNEVLLIMREMADKNEIHF